MSCPQPSPSCPPPPSGAAPPPLPLRALIPPAAGPPYLLPAAFTAAKPSPPPSLDLLPLLSWLPLLSDQHPHSQPVSASQAPGMATGRHQICTPVPFALSPGSVLRLPGAHPLPHWSLPPPTRPPQAPQTWAVSALPRFFPLSSSFPALPFLVPFSVPPVACPSILDLVPFSPSDPWPQLGHPQKRMGSGRAGPRTGYGVHCAGRQWGAGPGGGTLTLFSRLRSRPGLPTPLRWNSH